MNVGPVELSASVVARTEAGWRDYLAITCLDHSTKHVFIVQGIVLAYLLRGVHAPPPATSIVLGFLAAICVASANHFINEWLDRDSISSIRPSHGDWPCNANCAPSS